jgi:hypothetical protein
MQIEESFRDVKSFRFGMGFELNLTRCAERLEVLLLVAMLATVVAWLLGMSARASRQYRQYQANTIKTRHVLLAVYLGLRVANDRRFRFHADDINAVGSVLVDIVVSHANGW